MEMERSNFIRVQFSDTKKTIMSEISNMQPEKDRLVIWPVKTTISTGYIYFDAVDKIEIRGLDSDWKTIYKKGEGFNVIKT